MPSLDGGLVFLELANSPYTSKYTPIQRQVDMMIIHVAHRVIK